MFKEKLMIDDLPVQTGHSEAERNSFNAAFHALGLRWYWDTDTYDALVRRFTCTTERLRHYLEAHQAHLLKAYDAEFLVDAIRQTQLKAQRAAPNAAASRPFDWAQTLGSEIGV